MKCNDSNIVLVGQLGVEFDEGGIGLIGNELSDQLFVGCQFQIDATLPFLGSDGAGLSVLFDERINGRAADRVLANEVFDGNAFCIRFQNTFS
jgi:hypothetical protein